MIDLAVISTTSSDVAGISSTTMSSNSRSFSFSDYTNGTNDSYCEPYQDGICIDVYCPIRVNLIQFWIGGIFLNIVGFIGIFGNVLSMVILSRPQMRSSINYLLIGLARCDTVLILTAMLLFGFRGIYPYTGYLFWYYNYVYPRIVMCFYPIATSAQTASIYLTLMVSLERYVAVCHPLRAVSPLSNLLTRTHAHTRMIVCCEPDVRSDCFVRATVTNTAT